MKAGELITYLQALHKDTELYIGYGESAEPLRYISRHGDGIIFHSDIYMADPLHNIRELMSLKAELEDGNKIKED